MLTFDRDGWGNTPISRDELNNLDEMRVDMMGRLTAMQRGSDGVWRAVAAFQAGEWRQFYAVDDSGYTVKEG